MATLKCPTCGNDDPAEFEYCDFVPHYSPVVGIDAATGSVTVASAGDNMFYEGSQGGVFYCRANDCNTEIPAEGIEVIFD